ncbi:hypothetical protein TNCV_1087521 [Trichonephila clavipes]|nr:hypothetical protein TNCV_1087521 [Trichonephila clavipes]
MSTASNPPPEIRTMEVFMHRSGKCAGAPSYTNHTFWCAVAGSPYNKLSDEAHFWLNDYVNKQNCRIWSEANPQGYVETPLHPEKLTVWCALWAGGILLQKRRRPQRYSQW